MPDWSFKYDVGGVAQGGPTILLDPTSGNGAAWFGTVRVNSATGAALYGVATTRVNTDSIFQIGMRWVGTVPSILAGHVAPEFAPTSICAGSGFILRSVASTAVASFFCDWILLNPR